MFRFLIFFLALPLAAADLVIPLGYKSTLFSKPGQTTNISAFAFDHDGRCFVVESFRQPPSSTNLSSRSLEDRVELLRKELGTRFDTLTNQSERIRILEDTDRDGQADSFKIFCDGFNRPFDGMGRSLLAVGNEIYLTCSPDLWLVRENSKQSLHTGFGIQIVNPEHDLGALASGPDGRIYFGMGDSGLNVQNREGEPLILSGEGAILRCEPDGSKLEIFARGLKNPRDLAFNDTGDLFAIDGNRLLYVIEHGDYGWRAAKPIPSPLPAIATFKTEPTAFLHSDNVSLPGQFRNAFFMASGNTISNFHLKPLGSSFEVFNNHRFLSGVTATDLQFGPKGGLYLSEKKGAIHHVYDPAFDKKNSRSLPQNPGALADIVLKNTNIVTTIQAIQMLSQFARKGNPVAQQTLFVSLTSTTPEIRAQSARAIGEANFPQAGPTLAQLLADPSPRVRLLAAISIARLKHIEAHPALFEMMKDKDPWLAFAARTTLFRIAPRQNQMLQPAR